MKDSTAGKKRKDKPLENCQFEHRLAATYVTIGEIRTELRRRRAQLQGFVIAGTVAPWPDVSPKERGGEEGIEAGG